ncbi:translation initiation factor eIF2B delta subunit [Metarhizium album ARSEF 1941]|uniref:Translation initiation factor eIF2B subunit delta n=1 Tax=Metarhizium album (strain ARSEF 1941) TaxID=1081103 RepID=A0A0B2WVW9_METAS|nr:translation initiation factor eIF2B delta subunit [Metarhizium album ARSEF 1941]KHO00287.1 translation initiation factor eIF2B delta subunit [Metarhizium album ARSEF 1941]
MAAEGGQPAPAGDAAVGKDCKDAKLQGQPRSTQQKDRAAPAPPGAHGEKKLSNAELKKKAKEEKAARRAQAKAAHVAAAPAGPSGAQDAAGDAKSGKDRANTSNSKQGGLPSPTSQRSASRSVQPRVAKELVKPRIPECFSHLSMARRIAMTRADKDVSPVVLALGQQMSTFAIGDSTTRLEATLLAFKKVIDAYTTPHSSTFSRHFTSHVLNPQIEYLTACRPMCFSMGNAIRWLKLQISKIDIDLPDADAKRGLCQAIDNFIHERIVLADFVIVKTAADMVEDGQVILTYAHHRLVERSLLQAKSDGKQFKVILVDDPFDRVGLEHAKKLAAAGIPVTYASDMGALWSNLQEATIFFAAAEAMFSNGSMYAHAGTCDIATAATDLGLRVVALCETINFTERVSIDSLTYNEIDPERNTDKEFRLLFDTTRDKFISVVVTELGNSSAMSVPAILRKLEEL